MTLKPEPEVTAPGDVPKLPKGVAMMIRAVLGVDPGELSRQFTEAFGLVKNFCLHADGRFVAIGQELKDLRLEIERLKNAMEASPGLVRILDNAGKEHEHGGTGSNGKAANGSAVE